MKKIDLLLNATQCEIQITRSEEGWCLKADEALPLSQKAKRQLIFGGSTAYFVLPFALEVT